MRLFHFSEESSIERFVPRVKANRTNMPPVVWAIDEEHQFTFFFPRDCPRIVYTRSAGITDEDEQKFFGLSHANIVITAETSWYERIKHTTLYRYELPTESFERFDESAGYYISTETLIPINVHPLPDLLSHLMKLGIEVRFSPNLHPLRDAILNSSLTDFGIHRFQHATNLVTP
ncbi:DUF6886 family protein [Paenibacillus glycanilyticus]|uniref:DUF4433 domain-containing protein n=1 Tax=Paenibacillus glycanilyticus TaxID=126569 RepID=A0ABQ6GEZ7_9BACL|nr:DUF6886 family protein [Paenibacillus glycanilyticus]GLX68222.1 hypothetical protein MU1_25670 [Paenibacillus glycanilyticus]